LTKGYTIDQVKFERGVAVLDFPPTWFEVSPDDEAFKKLMMEINDLLSGPEPKDGENCPWCKYRRTSLPIQSSQNDLAF